MSFLVALALLLSQDTFTRFSYCHDNSQGPFEFQCIQLNSRGAGEFHFKHRGGAETRIEMALSPRAKDQFVALLAGTKFLAEGARYESTKKVADLGPKRLSIDMPSGSREAVFNYSTIKEVAALSTFFEALINQQMLALNIESAIKYDRLEIPSLVEQIETELKSNRIADPIGLVPLLEKIEQDSKLLDYARANAGKLRERLIKSQR